MILVDWQIREAIDKGEFVVSPFDDSLINPASIDIRLGDKFTKLNYNNSNEVDPLDKSSFTSYTQTSNKYTLLPKEFVLATTLEKVEFNGVCGIVKGKSSLGRLGLMQSSVAGWIDIGFVADGITLELFNYSDFIITLTAGMKIGQLVLIKTEKPSKSYLETGRYNYQSLAEGSKGI